MSLDNLTIIGINNPIISGGKTSRGLTNYASNLTINSSLLNGFTKYHHTVKNFFVDNYEEEIWDGDLHCIDMYYYYKNL